MGARRHYEDEEPEGVSYEEAGVDLRELEAAGYFDCVTDEHRRKAALYFAKIDKARAARLAPQAPAQTDLFA